MNAGADGRGLGTVAAERRRGDPLLGAAAWVYRGIVAARDAGFRAGLLRAEAVPARVISVGNLAAGGTGKTPLVALVAGQLMAMGRRVAILSRGYGRAGRGRRVVAPGDVEAGWRGIGDEPALLRRALPGVPLVIGADRVASAREAIRRFGADTLVLDDGFQHRWLRRDVDIVLLDALYPLDNGHLLPRGLLREPPGALARAHLLVLTADVAPPDWAGLADRLAPWAGGVPVAGALRVPTCWMELASGARAAPGALAGRRAVAFAGIARPRGFKDLASALGIEVAAFLPFADHHAYAPADLAAIAAAAHRHGAELAVTTEKDAVRLAGLPLPDALPIQVLCVVMELAWGAAGFWTVVVGRPAAQG